MPPAARAALRGLARVPHGGPDHAELAALGRRPDEVLDFSVNSNPLGCHPAVRAAAFSATIERYPDSQATAFVRALAAHLGCQPEQVLATSGSLEALRLAAQAYLEPGDVGLVAAPTFGEYALAIQVAGGVAEQVWLADRDFWPRTCPPGNKANAPAVPAGTPMEGCELPSILASSRARSQKDAPSRCAHLGAPSGRAGAGAVGRGLTQQAPPPAEGEPGDKALFALLATARERRARVLYLCQPNNPTGVYWSKESIERLVDALPDTLVVLDEAYIAFVADAWRAEALLDRPNLLVVRSLTKDHALAGLRVGYALGAPEVLAPLRVIQPAWSVSAPAQAAALAALDHPEHVAAGRALALAERDFLQRELRALGLAVWPSAAHFFLVEVGDAARLRAALLRQGIQVRDCASFGLPTLIRIAPRTRPENERLLAALRLVLQEGGLWPS